MEARIMNKAARAEDRGLEQGMTNVNGDSSLTPDPTLLRGREKDATLTVRYRIGRLLCIRQGV
jgi:hypothetical protein